MAHFKSIRSLQQLTSDLSPKKRRPSKRPSLTASVFGGEAEEERSDWVGVASDGTTEAKVTLPKSVDAQTVEQLEALEQLDAHIDKMFFLAGQTAQKLPLLVFCSCHIPKSKAFDLPALLQRLRVRLEAYVQAPYAAIVFASPMHAQISTAQLLSFYVNLNRPAKKNLQRLYVVHAGFWTRMLIRFFLNGIVSTKVGKRRKIVTEACLSELAKEVDVDVTQIDIPREVYEWNLKLEPSIRLPTPQKQEDKMFDVPLELSMGAQGQRGLPRVVKDCVQHIRKVGLTAEGIFRLSPSSALLKILKEAYDRGHPITLDQYETSTDSSAHLAAALLKLFLRSLPSPLITSKDYSIIEKCPDPTKDDGDSAADFARDSLLPALAEQDGGEARVILLGAVLELLYDVSQRSISNKMDAHNLAICIAPILVRSDDMTRDVRMCHVPAAKPASKGANALPKELDGSSSGKTTLGALLKLMISRFHEIFPDVPLDATARRPPSLPHSPQTTPPMPSSQSFSDLYSPNDSSSKSPLSSPSASPRVKRVGRARTTTANSRLASIYSGGTTTSALSFGATSGKKSLGLLQGRDMKERQRTVSNGTAAETSSVAAMGVFDAS